MGLGGVAIATLPSVICAKLMFSDGLGGGNLVVSLRLNTFTKIELNKWLNEPFTPPPEPAEEE